MLTLKAAIAHKTMKKIIVLISLCFAKAMAQQTVENTHQIEGAMLSYYNTYGSEVYNLPTFKNTAFSFGFVA
jgi:hypothetical protein